MKVRNFIELVKIETKLIFRVPDVYVIAFGLPMIACFIISAIANVSSSVEVIDSFGGIMSIGIIGTGVMGLSSIITDNKHNGVYKRLGVTPVRQQYYFTAICISLIFLSVISSLIVIGLYYSLFNIKINTNILVFILTYCFSLISTFSIGMTIACLSPNRNVANLVTILIYFPSLLLSGTTIPREQLPPLLKNITNILPITHSVSVLQTVLTGNGLIPIGSIIYLFVIILIALIILRKKIV